MSGKNDSSEKYAREAARLVQPWRRKSEAAPRISRKTANIWAGRLAIHRQKIKANSYLLTATPLFFETETMRESRRRILKLFAATGRSESAN